MLDAQCGDAYVVDLNHGGTANDPKHWRRYVIDTGYPVGKGKVERRASLAKSVYKHESNEFLPRPPWYTAGGQVAAKRPNLPPLSGIIITHSDRDHFGNAPWLIKRLQQLKGDKVPMNNTFGQDYVMLSPMWAWTTQVVKQVTEKKPPKDEGADEVDDPPEDDGDDDVNQDAENSDGEAPQIIPGIHEDVKPWNLGRFCDLEFGFTNDGMGVRFTLTHKKKLDMSTRKTWRGLLHLAKQARYHVMYRINSVNKSATASYQEWPSERLTRLSRLHISRTDEFVTSRYQYTNCNFGNFYFAGKDLANAKNCNAQNPHNELLERLERKGLRGEYWLVEVILVPDTAVKPRPRTSYVSNRTDDRTISGSWLRNVYDLHDVYMKRYEKLGSNPATAPKKNEGMIIEDRKPNVPVIDDRIEEERFQRLPAPSSDIGRYTGALLELKAFPDKVSNLKPPIGQDREDSEAILKKRQHQSQLMIDTSQKRRAETAQQIRSKEVGYCPRYFIIGLDDTFWQLPLGIDDLQGHYSTSFLGGAGEEYVRDFAHYILQYKLSGAAIEPQYYDVGLEPNTDTIEGALKYSDEYGALDPNFKTAGLRLVKLKRITSPNWGHYANRASIIAHFIRTRQRCEPFSFDEMFDNLSIGMEPDAFRMLFTGDALELGHGPEISYTPEKKITKTYFEGDIGKLAAKGYMQIQPTGNLLTWLQRQQLMKATRINVLKVPHHGSKTTTTAQFYHFISADVYLISGAWTPHGHPDPETIQSIFATIIREDGDPLSPSQFYSKANSTKTNLPHIREVCCLGVAMQVFSNVTDFLTSIHNYSANALASCLLHGNATITKLSTWRGLTKSGLRTPKLMIDTVSVPLLTTRHISVRAPLPNPQWAQLAKL